MEFLHRESSRKREQPSLYSYFGKHLEYEDHWSSVLKKLKRKSIL